LWLEAAEKLCKLPSAEAEDDACWDPQIVLGGGGLVGEGQVRSQVLHFECTNPHMMRCFHIQPAPEGHRENRLGLVAQDGRTPRSRDHDPSDTRHKNHGVRHEFVRLDHPEKPMDKWSHLGRSSVRVLWAEKKREPFSSAADRGENARSGSVVVTEISHDAKRSSEIGSNEEFQPF
jgi:hypothetical protein